ncbi:hypothetical protein R3P38DRAFT_3113771 [Favolaschia claudopus]|uniref:F-box domain-containing protein n=1 Tax=Favolaschia claudopus TaxID=2862362 RepID=A0AAV9ZHT7_9AGAR
MAHQNPLKIAEIVDICFEFLSGSTSDLLQYSTVAHSWVDATQSRLFRVPHATNPQFPFSFKIQVKFLKALNDTPRLACYVRELNIHVRGMTNSLCELPFTRLEGLSLFAEGHFPIRYILVPSVRYLNLSTCYQEKSLVSFWTRCPPSIEHLEYCPRSLQLADDLSACDTASPVQLKSLRLDVRENVSVAFSPRILFPFDLSKLKALSLQAGMSQICESIDTLSIEILEIDFQHASESWNLASFPSLTTLRINTGQGLLRIAARTLGSITPQQKIRSICISVDTKWMQTAEFEQLDAVLALLPLAPFPSLEFEAIELGPTWMFPASFADSKPTACSNWDMSSLRLFFPLVFESHITMGLNSEVVLPRHVWWRVRE